MNTSRLIFITSDPLNPVIIKLISAISQKLTVVVLSDVPLDSGYPVEKHYFSYKYGRVSKFFGLFYSPSQARQEKQFPKRNMYRRGRYIINFLFYCKKVFELFVKLPTYSQIYRYLYRNKEIQFPITFQASDICITDSNLRHVYYLIPAVIHASIHCKHLIALVYSWDNTHYSTLMSFADSYLVWNQRNKEELVNWYGISEEKIFLTGSLIHDYLIEHNITKVVAPRIRDNGGGDCKLIYAAVVSPNDSLMARHEVRFILAFGREMYRRNPKFKLLFRAYPSRGQIDILLPLRKEPWIELYEHKNFVSIPRLGNKNEEISFSVDASEKIMQFYMADALLSTGSTYTLEFAFTGLPIIHLDARKFQTDECNQDFFDRLALYGHLDILSDDDYAKNLPTTIDQIYTCISNLKDLRLSGYSDYLFSLASVSREELAKDKVMSQILKCI